MPSVKLTCAALILIACITAPCSADIRLEGFVPAGIDKYDLSLQYSRICTTIAPQSRPDLSTIHIIFYTKSLLPKGESPLPEWGGGGAVGRDTIIIPIDASPFLNLNLYQVAVHELVHITLNRAYQNIVIPRWFHEGVAMTLAGELSLEERMTVAMSVLGSGLLPLEAIDSVNHFSRSKANFAYCLSHQAVLLLVNTYGMDVIADILEKARAAGGFDAGLFASLSVTQKEIEAQVKKEIGSNYWVFFAFADTYVVWVGISVLFVAGFIVTRIRRKKQLAAMVVSEELVPDEQIGQDSELPDDELRK